MKTHYKAIITIAISLLYITANAQWYRLRHYPNPDSNKINYYADPVVLPQAVDDGHILFFIPDNILGGHTGGGYIMESHNDLLNFTTNFYISIGLGSIAFPFATSKNDSVICFGYTSDFIPSLAEYLYYTKNDFKSFDTIRISSVLFPPYNNSPIDITNNFAYAAPLILSPYSHDTLVIHRFNLNNSTDTVLYISGYISPGTIHFTSDSIGFLSCLESSDTTLKVLLRTADSGRTWKTCFTDSIDSITDFFFPDANIGYLTESNGAIYKTTNAGSSWIKLASPATTQLNCVSFANDSLGYIGGSAGTLYKTINSGTTWTVENSGTKNNIIALYTFGTVAYFKDDTGALYKDESPMGIQGISSTTPTITVYPNPSKGLFNIHIANGQQLLANSCIKVYNLFGENIATICPMPSEGQEWTLNLSTQSSGVYFYRIIDSAGNSLSNGKLILSK